MRILFEGTESQVKNLLLVMESTKIDMPKRLENYALDGHKEVKPEHVAEAIYYLPEILTPSDLEQLKQIV